MDQILLTTLLQILPLQRKLQKNSTFLRHTQKMEAVLRDTASIFLFAVWSWKGKKVVWNANSLTKMFIFKL